MKAFVRILIGTMFFLLPAQFYGADHAAHSESGAHEAHGEHGADEHNAVNVSKASQDIIEVKTVTAKLVPFEKKISVVGQVAQDPEITVSVPAPGSGTIAECNVHIGSIVNKGEKLCSVSLNGTGSLAEVRSPIAGVVIGGYSKVGEKVDGVSSLHVIADMSRLAATFDVYEKDIKDVEMAQKVCVRSVAYPDKCFDGEVVFISPRVERDTNTIKIRAVVQNPDNLLKLGMFVSADIITESREKYIVLPLEAVHTVDDKKAVFIKTADEKFEKREIVVKDQSGSQVAVSAGISEGDKVVAENGFLIKSELLKSKMGAGCAD